MIKSIEPEARRLSPERQKERKTQEREKNSSPTEEQTKPKPILHEKFSFREYRTVRGNVGNGKKWLFKSLLSNALALNNIKVILSLHCARIVASKIYIPGLSGIHS